MREGLYTRRAAPETAEHEQSRHPRPGLAPGHRLCAEWLLKVDGMLSASQVAQVQAHLEQRWRDGSLATSQGTPIASIYGDPLLDGRMETIRPRME
jgi:hypothetical protein